MGATVLFGGSGLLGETFLRLYPEIISAGRTKPNTDNKHIDLVDMDNLLILDNIEIDNVIFLIGNSNHHEINNSCMMGIEYNLIPLKKALHYFSTRKINRFVCLTSILLYGNKSLDKKVDEKNTVFPYQNEYIFSKYLAEQVVEFYKDKVPVINIRLSNVYGATSLIRPDLVPTLILDSLTKENPTVWNTKPIRDFIFADDAAEAVMELLKTDYTGTINLGSGTMYCIKELVEIIEQLSGKKITSLDKEVTGVMKFVTDITLIHELTGWMPKHTLEQGLTKAFNIMKDNLVLTLDANGDYDANKNIVHPFNPYNPKE